MIPGTQNKNTSLTASQNSGKIMLQCYYSIHPAEEKACSTTLLIMLVTWAVLLSLMTSEGSAET
jgi:hypothetical protein